MHDTQLEGPGSNVTNFCKVLFTLTPKAVNTQHAHMQSQSLRPAEMSKFLHTSNDAEVYGWGRNLKKDLKQKR